jgi:hypothetical protein
MLNESFAFVAAQGMFGFGEGDQGESMAGSKYTSLA